MPASEAKDRSLRLEFTGSVWYWKGPAPFFFLTVPDEPSRELDEVVARVTYGWGMVPVDATIGATHWRTSLWPKDGGYILPIKAAVRKAELLDEGDLVTAAIQVRDIYP